MRVHKIKGYKICFYCGVRYPYHNKRRRFCNIECSKKYIARGGIKERPITLPFIPDRLIIKEQKWALIKQYKVK